MDLANLTDAEARAVMALTRARHERRRYAQVVAEAEEQVEALGEADKAKALAALADEPARMAADLAEARARLAARKAEGERMAAAQAEVRRTKEKGEGE